MFQHNKTFSILKFFKWKMTILITGIFYYETTFLKFPKTFQDFAGLSKFHNFGKHTIHTTSHCIHLIIFIICVHNISYVETN